MSYRRRTLLNAAGAEVASSSREWEHYGAGVFFIQTNTNLTLTLLEGYILVTRSHVRVCGCACVWYVHVVCMRVWSVRVVRYVGCLCMVYVCVWCNMCVRV